MWFQSGAGGALDVGKTGWDSPCCLFKGEGAAGPGDSPPGSCSPTQAHTSWLCPLHSPTLCLVPGGGEHTQQGARSRGLAQPVQLFHPSPILRRDIKHEYLNFPPV